VVYSKMEIAQAYCYCHKITRREARNFYYAFITLPRKQRQAIYAAYAFFRMCDDIADEEMSVLEKQEELQRCRDDLALAYGGHPKGPIMLALIDAATRFDIPQEHFQAVVTGVEMDLTINRYQTFNDLREYCFHVAAVVGLVCVRIFGCAHPEVIKSAEDLGVAMQITNIMRDLKEDALRDRVYLPQDEMASFSYTEEELKMGVVNQAFKNLMDFQARRARTLFQNGARFLPMIPWRSRACAAIIHGIYYALLQRMEARHFDVFRDRVRIGTVEKLFIMGRRWIQSVFTRIPREL
jgi:phytoene synthase